MFLSKTLLVSTLSAGRPPTGSIYSQNMLLNIEFRASIDSPKVRSIELKKHKKVLVCFANFSFFAQLREFCVFCLLCLSAIIRSEWCFPTSRNWFSSPSTSVCDLMAFYFQSAYMKLSFSQHLVRHMSATLPFSHLLRENFQVLLHSWVHEDGGVAAACLSSSRKLPESINNLHRDDQRKRPPTLSARTQKTVDNLLCNDKKPLAILPRKPIQERSRRLCSDFV